MEYQVSIVPDDRDLSWSDSNSTSSESDSSAAMPQSPIWTTPATTARMDAGQLSPISTEFDVPMHDRAAGSTLPPMIHSATSSSSTDSWSESYSEDVETGSAERDDHWDHGPGEGLAVPKLEPLEDDDNFSIDNIQEAPRISGPEDENGNSIQLKTKRPRGRPRKHPIAQPIPTNKMAKGRSKTGCITCRKRKKKCDEAKPRCMNCEKNAVVCEGYHEKQIWKSGRERAEEEQRIKQNRTHISLPPLFQGLDGPEDMVFLSHYHNHLSGVLTVENQHKNAFKDMLFKIAVEHRGLMHSILSMSSKHIDWATPYGKKILETNSKVSLQSLLDRSTYHHDAAMSRFVSDLNLSTKSGNSSDVNLSVRYGQMLCMLIQTAAEGGRQGHHRVHLAAYKDLIASSPPSDTAFLIFITEFFQYRVFADELIRYPSPQSRRLASEDWIPWVEIKPPRLIGIADGLFHYLSQITTIRNFIRDNMTAGNDPVVDYSALYNAANIDDAIRAWEPHWPPGDSRDRVADLYRAMMLVYLYRTIYPPSMSSPAPPPILDLSNSIESLVSTSSLSRSSIPSLITQEQQQPSMIQTPPMERPPSNHHRYSDDEGDVKVDVNGDDDDDDTDGDGGITPPPPRADSPPPIRYPPHHDHRITLLVDESIAIMDSFKPGDPVQALLLVPCLIIGCASFAPAQRERVGAAVRAVRGYTGLRNCELVIELLEEVWRLMERGEWTRVWDWQGVARSLRLDFSCA